MPRIIWNLSKREQLEHVARAQWLHSIGVDINVPRLPSCDPAVDFEIGYDYSLISNWYSDIVLVTGARITRQCSGTLQVDEAAVSLPWDGPPFDLLDMPTGNAKEYQIPPGLTLPRDQVLNDQLAPGVRLQRGKTLSGLLVLVGWDAQLPAQYCHGSMIRIEISLSDCSGAELRAKGAVRIDRKLEGNLRAALPRKKMAEGAGLFAGKPPVSIIEELARSSNSVDVQHPNKKDLVASR